MRNSTVNSLCLYSCQDPTIISVTNRISWPASRCIHCEKHWLQITTNYDSDYFIQSLFIYERIHEHEDKQNRQQSDDKTVYSLRMFEEKSEKYTWATLYA